MKEVKGIFCGLFLSLLWMLVASNFLQFLSGSQFGQIPSYIPERYILFISLIWAPLWEELVYRWAPVQLAVKTNYEYLIPFIVLSSAAFGWAHGFPQEGIFIQGILGLILSGVYIYTGKIWCSMATHSLYNLTVFFI